MPTIRKTWRKWTRWPVVDSFKRGSRSRRLDAGLVEQVQWASVGYLATGVVATKEKTWSWAVLALMKKERVAQMQHLILRTLVQLAERKRIKLVLVI